MSDSFKGPSFKGPVAWMAQNAVAANLLMFIVFVGGALGLFRIKQEVFPEFDPDMVSVSVVYPGATPDDVEQGIIKVIEEEVRGIDGVKRINSNASEGVGTVTIELLLDADKQAVRADVENAIGRITSFPEDAEEPQVALASSRREVISLVIAGDTDLRTLHDIAEDARLRLLDHPDVTQVELDGVPPLEMAVEIRRADLERYGLTLDQVAAQIAVASRELPGGEIETRGGEFLVRLDDRRRSVDEFAAIVLRGTTDGAVLRLGDVATITDGYADTDQEARFNGKPAVRVTAYRVGNETPQKVAAATREVVEVLKAELPPSIEVATWSDSSELLEGRIRLLIRNAIQGLVLVLLTLALFLNLRLAVWVALGIPISFFGAFLLLPGFDQTINMVSLFAFIVTLGLVVDDAIVVGENVFEKLDQGVPPLQAAIEGTQRMVVPVTFAVLTSVTAFAPLLFVPGFTGKIFKLIPIVVISVLMFSLLESFFVLPAHLGHDKGRPGFFSRAFEPPRLWVAARLEAFTNGPYARVVEAIIRQRYLALGGSIALLFITLSLVPGGVVPFDFFPKLEADVVTATARLPYGAPIETTRAVGHTLEAAAREAIAESGGDGIVRGMYTRVGEGPQSRFAARETGSHLLTVELNLVPSDERDIGSQAFAAAWRSHVPVIPGVEVLQISSAGGPGAGAAVDVMLSHADTAVLAEASTELTGILKGYGDLTDVENGWASGKPQLDYSALPAADTLGLGPTDVGRQLRASFFGAEALREQRGRNEVKVMVRLPPDERRSEFDLEQLRVRTPGGGFVPLSYVADFERNRAPTSILREDGKRVINVSAELAPGVKSAQEVLRGLSEGALPKLVEKYPGLSWEFAGQQRAQVESFAALGQGFVLALFVIFALLAVPFRSYIQPVIIMSAIPFGLVGAIGGHLVMGFTMSIISVFGIIALSGVVVNDSLVLVDAANEYRAEGSPPLEAVLKAGRRRLRPILLTSLTTFFGLMPMIFETDLQAKFLIPMAISLGYGVLFTTVIVLLLVPALYMIVEDVRERIGRGSEEVVVEVEGLPAK
ncbi:MAG: efflux RND transporter permease subunit [Alphaproteobacteria bacterium]|nr:efflux RND transporter permease subunit [Alphaproteobacteria bacterium]